MSKRTLASMSWDESKKMWSIAWPAILTAVAQNSINFITIVFVGHLGGIQLAAITVVVNLLGNLAKGFMLGMGSALETLCGQAVGAGSMNMLGIYMQRSWIITGVTALVLTPIYLFASPLLKFIRQDDDISQLAGKYSTWVIPQLYAYAFNYPMQKFFQSQSKLEYGMAGAAIAGNISWWLINLSQMIYIVSGSFPDSWTGFSILAFKSLSGFVKLSLASAIMLCLELWYYTAVILLVGSLKHPEVAVNAVSICMNLQLWTLMIALGFNAAVSVRVSNELGANQPKSARVSVMVAITTSVLLGIFFTVSIVASKSNFPRLFTERAIVVRETSRLGYILAATILLNSIQPVLHGVAVGAGWQFQVAFVNFGCYYVFGLPIGALLGYKFGLGVQGIWSGMLVGSLLQTIILLLILYRTNWEKEALQARERIKTWGVPSESYKMDEKTSRPSTPSR
ncbi:hypothetical protein ACHQM5_016999 [Ranunculus cassubicifolius]